MRLSLQSLPLPSHPPLFSCLHLACWGAPVQNNEAMCCWLRVPVSWGDVGDAAAESVGVMTQKLWLLPSTSLGTQLGARTQPPPPFSVCSLGMGILGFLPVMSLKFLFLQFICLCYMR